MEPSTCAPRRCPVSVNTASILSISALATLTIRRDHWPAEPCPGRWRCLCSDGRFVSGTDLLRNQSSERLESAESQQPTDTRQYQGTCCGGPRARHGTC